MASLATLLLCSLSCIHCSNSSNKTLTLYFYDFVYTIWILTILFFTHHSFSLVLCMYAPNDLYRIETHFAQCWTTRKASNKLNKLHPKNDKMTLGILLRFLSLPFLTSFTTCFSFLKDMLALSLFLYLWHFLFCSRLVCIWI